jgi:hypothetical protein
VFFYVIQMFTDWREYRRSRADAAALQAVVIEDRKPVD